MSFADGVKPGPNCVYDLASGRPYTAAKLTRDAQNEVKALLGGMTEPAWPEVKPEHFQVREGGLRFGLPVHFDVKNNLIYVSHSYFADRSMADGATAYKASIQHLLGHSIFRANIARHNEAWAKANNPGFFRRLIPTTKKTQSLLDIAQPYEELFADLFPMLAFQNPDIMDFTRKYIAANPPPASELAGRHGRDVFSTVRNYLWRYYFSLGKNQGKEAEILAAVFETLAEDIIERANNPLQQYMSVDDLNDHLMRKLREKLKPFHS